MVCTLTEPLTAEFALNKYGERVCSEQRRRRRRRGWRRAWRGRRWRGGRRRRRWRDTCTALADVLDLVGNRIDQRLLRVVLCLELHVLCLELLPEGRDRLRAPAGWRRRRCHVAQHAEGGEA